MGLLHMGQTLRISNHFNRHLRKADEMRDILPLCVISKEDKVCKVTQLGLCTNVKNQEKAQELREENRTEQRGCLHS